MKSYRHAPTARGEPCPYLAWLAENDPETRSRWNREDCWAWAGDCEKRCSVKSYDERDKRAEARRRGPRIFPMPRHCGKRGHCAWCAGPILKAGEVNTRRGWHDGRDDEPDCLHAYYLHTRLETQRPFLLRRDGLRCCDCAAVVGRWTPRGLPSDPEKLRSWGPAWERGYPADVYVGPMVLITWETGLEVDHETPLWSVAELPDDERAAYFGPENLALRCPRCHKAKTRREAGERAALRSSAAR